MQEAFLQSIIFINIRAADEARDHLIEILQCCSEDQQEQTGQGRAGVGVGGG